MRYDLKEKKLVPKEVKRQVETVVTVRELCEICDGTGLIHDQYTYDCYKCQGHGMIQVSKRKEITYE